MDIFDFILRKMINQFNLLRMIRYVKNGQDLMRDGKGHEKKGATTSTKMSETVMLCRCNIVIFTLFAWTFDVY